LQWLAPWIDNFYARKGTIVFSNKQICSKIVLCNKQFVPVFVLCNKQFVANYTGNYMFNLCMNG